MENLYISMLGAAGTGKSSLLASMYYTFKRTAGDLGFVMKPSSPSDSLKLEEKHQEMLEHLYGVKGTDVGITATEVATMYALDLGCGVDNTRDPEYWLKLHFWDYPGVWIGDPDNRPVVIEQLTKSQVILIAIDSPPLLVDDKYGNYQLWHEKTNRPKAILDILSEVKFNTPKLVLFVPIKCEAWRLSSKASELILEQVKKGYQDVLAELKRRKYKAAVATTCVQTLGNYAWQYRTKEGGKPPKDKFVPINVDVNGRAEHAPRDVEQPLIYTLSFLSRQVSDILSSKVKENQSSQAEHQKNIASTHHRILTQEEERRNRGFLDKLFDWLGDADEEWERKKGELTRSKEEYLKRAQNLTEEEQSLFLKLAQIKKPLAALNKRRKDKRGEGFEIIQGGEHFELLGD